MFDYHISEEKEFQVLGLRGELIDKHQAIELMKTVDSLLESGKSKWAIDLSDLKYMNSSGLNVLIQILTRTRNKGGESVIFNVSKKVNELLVITKLNTLFKVSGTKEEAFEKLSK